MSVDWQIVHTMTNYWDGPVKGIAAFGDKPHFYERQFDHDADDWTGEYLLTPIDDDILRLAMEEWQIWRRWETAFHSGSTTHEQLLKTHPALPDDRPRHEQINAILEAQLKTDRSRAIRATAEFRSRADPKLSGKGWSPMEVTWSVVDKGSAPARALQD